MDYEGIERWTHFGFVLVGYPDIHLIPRGNIIYFINERDSRPMLSPFLISYQIKLLKVHAQRPCWLILDSYMRVYCMRIATMLSK